MWAAIFGIVIVMAIGAVAFLCTRVYRFVPLGKSRAFAPNRRLRMFECVIGVLAGIVVLCLAMGYVNAAIIVIHLVAFWLLAELFFYPIKKIRGKRFVYDFAGALAILTTTVYLSVGWALAKNVWATAYKIDTHKLAGDLRIVMFADSHVGSTFDGNGFSAHVKRMQACDPDIVIIAGDYVDDDTSRADMIAACRALGTLDTKYGVFYAFGNHDKGYYSDSLRSFTVAELTVELEKNNVTILQDEVKLIDDRFYVIGRQEANELRRGTARSDIFELTKDLDKDKFSIVINHQPTDYANEAKAGVDLVLSGHTHGGQMFPIGFISDLFGLNDRAYGREKRANTNFIVTSGISDWAMSFKTGCYSEFVIVDVHGSQAAR